MRRAPISAADARAHDALAGRVAIVTGAGRGLGLAITHALTALGVHVAALDIAPEGAAGVADLTLTCDVADVDQIDAAVTTATDELGAPTLLVSNAGVNAGADPAGMAVAEYDRFMAVDLRASWALARAAVPAMRQEGRGSIVNVSSNHALVTHTGMYPYAAAKAGLLGLTRSLALELAPSVRVNAVCPGWTRTPLVDQWLAEQPDAEAAERHIADRIPLGRISDAEEIADVVVFLLGPGARAITGATIVADGGVSIAANYA